MGRPSKADKQATLGVIQAAGDVMDATRHRVPTRPGALGPPAAAAPPGAQPAPTSPSGEDLAFDPLLTIDQLAHWLGKPKGTLYQWRSRRMGPRGIKVGNDVRYRRSEVEAYLDANTDKRSSA